jgi:DNA-binding PadR family transcriptional regulator
MGKKNALTLPDLVVLNLLSEQHMHGYQLVAELEARDVQDWAAISRPQVYYSLNKLLAQKLITEAKDSDSSLGPERTKYTVNARGSAALEEGLSSEDWAMQRPPPPFQTWMALSTHLPKATLRRMFAKRREYLERQVEKERQTLRTFENETGPMTVAGRLMVDLCVKMLETELDWIGQAKKQMLARR